MSDSLSHADKPRDPWTDRPTLESLRRHDILELRARFLRRLFPEVAGLEVVEIGSGPAHDSISFATRGAHITALDCSRTGLAIAREIYQSLELPLATAIGDARKLPFADGQFDIAFNGGVLEHFTDEQLEEVIDEMIRVVRPGGTVLAFCPNRYNIFYQTHLRRIAAHNYEFERSFTAAEMRQRFEARGLEGVQLSGVHIHPAPNYLLPAWFPKVHRIEPLMRALCRPLERAWCGHRLKSLIGQDFVLWATVPVRAGRKRSLIHLTGGPAVRDDLALGRAA